LGLLFDADFVNISGTPFSNSSFNSSSFSFFPHSFLVLFNMTSFDDLNTNTMQWFDGEDNQNPSVASGNTQLPNSTSSFSPLIFGLLNNQATRQPDLPVFDDIDILTYLMQADSENILAANTVASASAMDSIVSGDIVPMPTIIEQVDNQPIKVESVSDHVPPAYRSASRSPLANSPPQHLDLDLDEADWRPDPETLKKMTSKERRQLRNKISARNFRVRRKGMLLDTKKKKKSLKGKTDFTRAQIPNLKFVYLTQNTYLPLKNK
jgi:hypothetical protein